MVFLLSRFPVRSSTNNASLFSAAIPKFLHNRLPVRILFAPLPRIFLILTKVLAPRRRHLTLPLQLHQQKLVSPSKVNRYTKHTWFPCEHVFFRRQMMRRENLFSQSVGQKVSKKRRESIHRVKRDDLSGKIGRTVDDVIRKVAIGQGATRLNRHVAQLGLSAYTFRRAHVRSRFPWRCTGHSRLLFRFTFCKNFAAPVRNCARIKFARDRHANELSSSAGNSVILLVSTFFLSFFFFLSRHAV